MRKTPLFQTVLIEIKDLVPLIQPTKFLVSVCKTGVCRAAATCSTLGYTVDMVKVSIKQFLRLLCKPTTYHVTNMFTRPNSLGFYCMIWLT